jgi:hypothetical protein
MSVNPFPLTGITGLINILNFPFAIDIFFDTPGVAMLHLCCPVLHGTAFRRYNQQSPVMGMRCGGLQSIRADKDRVCNGTWAGSPVWRRGMAVRSRGLRAEEFDA